MSQRFVTHSVSSEQEYTYDVSSNEVGAPRIHVLVVQYHQSGKQILTDWLLDHNIPISTRRGRGFLGVFAIVDLGVVCRRSSCLYDDSQGRGQCNHGKKSSGGDDVHGGSKRFCTNGAYRTSGSFYTRVKLELYK